MKIVSFSEKKIKKMNELSGKGVLISDKRHPWFDHHGTCVEYRQMGILSKMGYLLKLENGLSCYAMADQFILDEYTQGCL